MSSPGAEIIAIEYALPSRIETNEELQRLYPQWDMEALASKSGVRQRHIAAPEECASDLAYTACRQLLDETGFRPGDLHGLIVCTQTPDYIMPPTATLLQHRLGLPSSVAAFDYTLACSGYIYGLAMCKAFIESGLMQAILLVNCDTYSKYIRPDDRATRTLFGDGAAATLVCRGEQGIGPVFLGTDGSGASKFIARGGGCRNGLGSAYASAEEGPFRGPFIEMDGFGVLGFVKKEIPPFVSAFLEKAGLPRSQVDLFVFHQASRISLEQVCQLLEIPPEKTFTNFDLIGNTVSASIPIAIREAWQAGKIRAGMNSVLVGFGVGLSWGGAIMRWTEAFMGGRK